MPVEKIAITLDRALVEEIDRGVRSGLYRNRSRAIEEAVREKLERHRRSVLVISHETLNRHSGTVIALAITSQSRRAGFPLTHPVESLRLPKPSWIKMSQVRTLSTERLGRRIGTLSTDEVDRVVEGLFELVG